jgi:alkanesulfonate monooxygenase SsuD/methylene tetrahydromethanopterin reductase-like flavin-dependent oxidoreductase (luciferase family)
MALKLGIHCGPQDISMADLRKLWSMGDRAGFHWISVWDHFYANPLAERTNSCFEGVAAMTALAATTQKVRVGCLMFCILFRNPGLLAKSAITIDHLSNGRVELGVGGGWFEEEFKEFGYGWPPIKERLDALEEGLQVLQLLLHEGQATFRGKHFQLEGAVSGPRPVQPHLRLWVGGRGEKRTPRIAAQYADGFNLPYVSPEAFREQNRKVDDYCAGFNRDPKSIERTVNLHFYMGSTPAGEQKAQAQIARLNPATHGGVLQGTAQQVIDRIGEYDKVGAQGVNIAFRPPVDWDAFETFIAKVLPVFHKR